MDRLLDRDVCELACGTRRTPTSDWRWTSCGPTSGVGSLLRAGGRGVRPPGSRRLLLCLGLPEVPLRETCFENGVILLSLNIKSIVLIAEKMNVKSQQLLSSCSGRLQISPILCPPFA
ncbi:hypothetical protein ACRRTK_020377 [Alexandromys fortis]